MVNPVIKLSDWNDINYILNSPNLRVFKENITYEEDKDNLIMIFDSLENYFNFTNLEPYILKPDQKEMFNRWEDKSYNYGPSLTSDGETIYFTNHVIKISFNIKSFEFVNVDNKDECVTFKEMCNVVYKGGKRILPFYGNVLGFIHRLLQFNFNLFEPTETTNKVSLLKSLKSEVLCAEIPVEVWENKLRSCPEFFNLPIRFTIQDIIDDKVQAWFKWKLLNSSGSNFIKDNISFENVKIYNTIYGNRTPFEINTYHVEGNYVYFSQKYPYLFYLDCRQGYYKNPGVYMSKDLSTIKHPILNEQTGLYTWISSDFRNLKESFYYIPIDGGSLSKTDLKICNDFKNIIKDLVDLCYIL